SVCAVDDPSDGRGPHDTGVYCANSATAGTNDRNPDDYKRVTVDLTWKTHRRVERSHQVTVVNHPGSAGGPAVTELSIAPPASAKITSPTGAVAFTANTSGSATSVAFSVDGAPSATANGTGTQWNFNWPIADLVDGTHLVTAQAFDSQGLSGATRSVTVTLNRFAPAAPTGLAGGRNGSVVELEWLPNPERDIVGYRVFRAGLSGATLVCPLARKITCVDESPPEGVLSYFVVAGDLSPAGEHRDGEPSPSIEVSTSNMAPHPPGDLSASRAGDTTTLQWGASAAADLQHGSVAFYRVYRDGTGRDDREYRTGTANDLTFVDGRTDGTTHQYWVTAVNSNLAESAPVGPVTM
ncbi:MAG TPA: Ig-like domain-containing protein, partial [Solirubrobacteraceae bacterium]